MGFAEKKRLGRWGLRKKVWVGGFAEKKVWVIGVAGKTFGLVGFAKKKKKKKKKNVWVEGVCGKKKKTFLSVLFAEKKTGSVGVAGKHVLVNGGLRKKNVWVGGICEKKTFGSVGFAEKTLGSGRWG